MKNGKCKHDIGWVVEKPGYIYVFPDNKTGDVSMGGSRYGAIKLKARCNSINCKATRNIYIKAEVVKLGKIKTK